MSTDRPTRDDQDPPVPAAPPSSREPSRVKKIAIGSQRDVADPRLAIRKSPPPAAPTAVFTAEPDADDPVPTAPVHRDVEVPAAPSAVEPAPTTMPSAPPKLEPVVESPVPHAHPAPATNIAPPLPSDDDQEIEAMLAGISMDQIVAQAPVAQPPGALEPGARIKAFVARIEGDHVFFHLQGRYEGVASLRQFRKPPEPGSLVEIVVKSLNEEEGLLELAPPGAAVDAEDWSTLNVGDVVEARVTGSNTGGLEVTVQQLRGFIPASQIDRVRVEQFGEYVNQKLQCLVTEVNPQRKKLVLSRRALLDREYEELRRQRLQEIQVGETYDGLVTRLADFGAFVDIGGVEGLVHISKLSWGHVKRPQDVVQVGQRIRVKVEKASPETGKFSLSHRDTTEHPWQRASERFPVGATVTGTVTRIAQFGAFVRLDSGIEGLVHISELSHGRVASVGQVLKEGQAVEVKILSMDEAAQRIGLSLKANLPPPENSEAPAREIEEPTRDPAIPKSSQPLRGGRGRDSAASRFGLNL